MKFSDFTIVNGTIHSHREQDSADINLNAMKTARAMLMQLRRGLLSIGQPLTGLPTFRVTLGLPDKLFESREMAERVLAPGRFFCVWQQGAEMPFQVNLVLSRDNDEPLREDANDPDQRAVGTLLGLSMALTGGEMSDEFLDHYEQLWDARPMLATALLPFTDDMELVQVAADFATCFAAAMLEEREG